MERASHLGMPTATLGRRAIVGETHLVLGRLTSAFKTPTCLPKYEPGGHNVKELGPLEKWLYFLKRAEYWEADELAEQLVDAEFCEAAGVLDMISKSPEDRQFYESRMKFLHDAEARLIAAREEGREEGMERGAAKGSLAGKIQVLQSLLGDDESRMQDLMQLGNDELSAILLELQERLCSRGG